MSSELASVATALNGVRVLVVEDIWIVAQSYISLLENLGAVVSGPASSVAKAFELIETGMIDAALVDMNLNGEMAYDVVDVLNSRGVPVVIVTGYDVVPGLENKVYTILKKPVRAEALIRSVRDVVTVNRARPQTAHAEVETLARGIVNVQSTP